MRLALVSITLQPGGAERVISCLANHWAGQGATVNMILLDGSDQAPYYHLAPEVHLSRLNVARDPGLVPVLHRIRQLRQALREAAAQVVVAFLPGTNVLTTLAAQGLGTKVVVSERGSIFDEPLPPPWPLLRNLAYRRADKIVFQTERARQDFSPTLRAKGVVLPNPVIVPREPSAALDAPVVIAVGRLAVQKGFDLLLKAFALVAPQQPTWSLVIWGEGPERGRLEALRETLGLGDRVRLPGTSSEPGAWTWSAGSIFVLPSRYEGFPNALCEAMATGHSVVASDCRFGPREIVTDGEDGLLVPTSDPRALAQALERLMGDPDLRCRLAAAARQSVRRFAIDDVMRSWTGLVGSVLGPNDHRTVA